MGRSHSHLTRSKPSGKYYASKKWEIIPPVYPLEYLPVDPVFQEIEAEVWGLGHYLVKLERGVLVLTHQATSEIEEIEEIEESDHFSQILQLEPALISQVLPRLFRCSFLVSLWAVFESGVLDCADKIRSARKVSRRLRNVPGDDFLDSARDYFSRVLRAELTADASLLVHLKKLQVLRNAIAHGHGRQGAVRVKLWNQIIDWSKESGSGISIEEGRIRLTKRFVREMYQTTAKVLIELVQRTRVITLGLDR